MKTLYLIRGVSGAGKSDLALTLAKLPNTVTVAADDYFTIPETGEYIWISEKLYAAHLWCRINVTNYMLEGKDIVVHNTLTTNKEIQPYIELAAIYDYKVVSLVVENRHGNVDVHNVPNKIRELQATKLLANIKLI